MPTIDGFKLPKEITVYYKELIEDAPADVMLRLAKENADDFKGLRLQKSSISSIKSRIKKVYLTGKKELGESLKFFLSVFSIHHGFIKRISRYTLETFFDDFQIIFGPHAFLGSMLLDDRKHVKEMAIECLQNKSFKADTDELDEDSKNFLRLQFGEGFFSTYLLDILRESDGLFDDDEDEVSNDKALLDSRDEVAELRKKFNESSKKLKENEKDSRQTLKRVKSLEGKIIEHAERINGLKAKLAAEKLKFKQADKDLKKLENKKRQLLKEMQESITAEVKKEVGTSVKTWLATPIKVEKEISGSTNNLLGKAEKALARQSEVDRHSGNMKKLAARLTAHEKAKSDIDRARTEALNPIGALKDISKELGREIFHIRKLLGLKIEESGVVTAVKALINESTVSSGLQQADNLINQVAELGLASSDELGVLQDYYKNAAWRMYDSRVMRHGKIDGNSPFEMLAYAIKNNTELLLFIDGHNIILSERNKAFFDFLWEVDSENEKRKALGNLTADVFKNSSNVEVRLYFDGPDHSTDNMNNNVKIVYSGGGKGDQRADNAIMSYLQFRGNRRDSRRLMIVTDDKELAHEAQSKNAIHVPVRVFGAVLNGLSG